MHIAAAMHSSNVPTASHDTTCLCHSSSCKPAQPLCRKSFHNRQPLLLRAEHYKRTTQQRCCSTSSVPAVAAGAALAAASVGLRSLHPHSKAVESGQLKVSDIHTLAYEVHGNPKGRPVLVVHGGPGAGCYANHARFFDIRKWKIVMVDQRGCGASTPKGCLQDNNTQELIQDFEKLRVHLRVKRWMLFGGSWGVALSLAYAQQHPSRVLSLVLRGVCLMRESEISWMYRGGAAYLHPLGWQNFKQHLTEEEQGDMVTAYHRRLTSADTSIRDAAAKQWLGWEFAASSGRTENLQWWDGSSWQQSEFPATSSHQAAPSANGSHKSQSNAQASTPATTGSANDNTTGAPAQQSSSGGSTATAASNTSAPAAMSSFTAQAMLECHYSKHRAFLESTPLLQGVNAIRHIPCIAVQGRLDFVCPIKTAYDLHCEWPEMELRVVPGAGHSMYDPAIAHELLEATDRMRQLPLPPPLSQSSRGTNETQTQQQREPVPV